MTAVLKFLGVACRLLSDPASLCTQKTRLSADLAAQACLAALVSCRHLCARPCALLRQSWVAACAHELAVLPHGTRLHGMPGAALHCWQVLQLNSGVLPRGAQEWH